MRARKVVAVLLIVAGVLALVYGGFTYIEDTHEADIGPIEFEIQEKERVNIPAWAGVGLVAVGVVLLLVGKR